MFVPHTSPLRPCMSGLLMIAMPILLLPTAAKTAPPVSAVDLLSAEETDAALDAIWKKTPEPAKRSPDSAKRAALQAYLQRLGPGTGLHTDPPVELNETDFPPLKLHSELLPGKIGYLRLGRLQPGLAERLESALRDFAQLGAHNLILDLRATPAQGTLADAAALAECFVPEGTPLFSQRTNKGTDAPLKGSRTPAARLRVLLITGPRTAGAIEAFAAVLRVRTGATVLGSPTRGEAADFEQVPLQNGRFLRLPTRLAVLPERPGLFPNGLLPDVPCSVSQQASDAALRRAAAEGRVAPLLHETERPRMNEAALVAGKNPEMEAWIQNQLQKKQPKKTQPTAAKDEALRLAVDFITALDTLNMTPTPLP
jgi:hypothetical protein